MNYGYSEPGFSVAHDPPSHLGLDNRYTAALYQRLVASVDLRGRDLLEVGCGRGGGAAFVARQFAPRRLVATDIARSAIAFCRRVHQVEGLEFRQADAERLPFAASAFDAVMNVESSFCYPSMERFLREVRRVLRPGGVFLLADMRFVDELGALDRAIAKSGMTVIARSDISENVSEALRRDEAQRGAMSLQLCPRPFRKWFEVFVGAQRTRIPIALADGRLRYFMMTIRKPA